MMEDVSPDSTFIEELKAQALRRVEDDKSGYISRAIGRGQMGQPEKQTEYRPEDEPTPWDDLTPTTRYERIVAHKLKKMGFLKNNPFGLSENPGYVKTDADYLDAYDSALEGDLPMQQASDWFFAQPDGEGGEYRARPEYIKNMDRYLMIARAYKDKLDEVEDLVARGGAGLAQAEAELEKIKAVAQSATVTPTFVDDPKGEE